MKPPAPCRGRAARRRRSTVCHPRNRSRRRRARSPGRRACRCPCAPLRSGHLREDARQSPGTAWAPSSSEGRASEHHSSAPARSPCRPGAGSRRRRQDGSDARSGCRRSCAPAARPPRARSRTLDSWWAAGSRAARHPGSRPRHGVFRGSPSRASDPGNPTQIRGIDGRNQGKCGATRSASIDT